MIEIIDNDRNSIAEAEDCESARYALSILCAEEKRDLRAIDANDVVVACGFYVENEPVRISVIQGGRR